MVAQSTWRPTTRATARAYTTTGDRRQPEELPVPAAIRGQRVATPRTRSAPARPANIQIAARGRDSVSLDALRSLKPGRLRGRAVRGFTLIEVLVALTIVAVALLAGVRAAGSMTQTNAECAAPLAQALGRQPHRRAACGERFSAGRHAHGGCAQEDRTSSAWKRSRPRRIRFSAGSRCACTTARCAPTCSPN